MTQTGADDGGPEGVAVHRVGRVGPGQLVDALQPMGQHPYAERRPPGRLSGGGAGLEVHLQRPQQGLGTSSDGPQRPEGAEHEVGHRLPVAREHRIDQQVGCVYDGFVEVEPLDEFEGAECLFVGVDHAARAGLRRPDGHPAAVRRRVRLLGGEGEDVAVVAGRAADQLAVLGGRRDAPVAEAGYEPSRDARRGTDDAGIGRTQPAGERVDTRYAECLRRPAVHQQPARRRAAERLRPAARPGSVESGLDQRSPGRSGDPPGLVSMEG